MNPLFHTEFSISDSLKNVRKSVLIYETIIRIWRLIPWTWSMKTTSIYFDNNTLNVQGVNLPLDLMIQLLFFVLLFVGIVLWFKKWEGQTKG